MYDNRNGFHYETVGDCVAVVRLDNPDRGEPIWHSQNDRVRASEFMKVIDAHTEQMSHGVSWRREIRPEYAERYGL